MGSTVYGAGLQKEALENGSKKPSAVAIMTTTTTAAYTATVTKPAVADAPPRPNARLAKSPFVKFCEREKRFKDKVKKLQAIKDRHGQFRVKKGTTDPLGSKIRHFFERTRREAWKYQNDPETSALNQSEMQLLDSIGFLEEIESQKPEPKKEAKSRPPVCMTIINNLKRWDESFEMVKEFKNQNDRLPTCQDSQAMYNWIIRQRRKVMESAKNEGKEAKLNNQQMVRLVSLGVTFTPSKPIYDISDRVEQWVQYREANGRNPSGRSELGEWAQRIVGKYRNVKLGVLSKTNLTPELVEKLTGAGFVFPSDEEIKAYAEKKEQDKDKKRFSWEESRQKCIEFKKKHGHMVVPRNEPHLGNWTHTQRKEYHRLKSGKNSFLTQQRLAKLVEIGFVFSNANWRELTSNIAQESDEDKTYDQNDDDDSRDDLQMENQDQRHRQSQHQQQQQQQLQHLRGHQQETVPGITQGAADMYTLLQLSRHGR